MRRRRTRFTGVLGVIAVVTAGVVSGGSLLASAQAATVSEETGAQQAENQRVLDAMGGSGSAGVGMASGAATVEEENQKLVGDIVFTPPSGTFQGQQSVTLSTSVAGAQIRYTTNGTAPSASSQQYSGPVTLTNSTQLRAQAFVNNEPSGAMGTQVYVARSFDANHDIPLVIIDAYGGGKPNKEQYKDAAVMVVDAQGGTASLSKTPQVATRAGFRLRGQSSANFEKAPYRLELWDNEGKDAEYPLLSMPGDGDWVLRGPFPDKSLIRDAFAYGVGREMGLAAPRYAFVEMYLNLDGQPMAANDYQGVYLLVESIERSKDRVNVTKLKETELSEPEITGGYIMQFNWMATEPPVIPCPSGTTACWSDLELIEPKEPPQAQITWISNYIQKFHNSLRSGNPSDPQTGYPAYIDVDSFVNRIIHNELSREGDAYVRSTHFYKDRGGKLVAGPLWDYDLGYESFTGMAGFGAPAGGTMSTVQGWQYQQMSGGGGGMMSGTSDWFAKLMADSAFQAKVVSRWQQLRQGILSDAQMRSRVDALASPLRNAAQRNFQKWPNLNTSQIGGFGTQVTQTWDEQLNIMKNYLTQRAAWLDSSNWQPSAGGTTTTGFGAQPGQAAGGFPNF